MHQAKPGRRVSRLSSCSTSNIATNIVSRAGSESLCGSVGTSRERCVVKYRVETCYLVLVLEPDA